MLLLSGCGTKEFNKYEGAGNEDNTSSVTESDKTENTISDKSIAEVFENQKQFFDTESQKYMHLKNYSSSNYMITNNNNKYEYVSDDAAGDKTLEVLQWCQLDMDSDGKEEVLLQMSNGNILVLRNEDNVVYGYAFPFRGMKNVKIDGSFEGSGSAANCYIGRLKFENKECFYEEICVVDELDKDNLMYRINKQDSNKEATVLYMEEQKKKEDAVWTVVETSDYYFKTLFEEKIGAITDKQVYETVVKDFDNSGTKEAFVLTI